MSLNSSAAQPPLSPQRQDTGLPAALPPDTPDVANPYEPEQTEPVLANRSANNSSAELAVELNQPPTLIAEHSAPEKSDRSSSASLEAESAITDDEITSLKKAAEQGNAEAQYKLAIVMKPWIRLVQPVKVCCMQKARVPLAQICVLEVCCR